MLLNVPAQALQSLADDYLRHLTPELRRLARDRGTMGVDDIAPQLEALEQTHGRAVFQPDFAHGPLAFVRSLVRSTQPQWWRTLIYMTISTMATAAPALLIEWVMTDFGAIQAAPLAMHNL